MRWETSFFLSRYSMVFRFVEVAAVAVHFCCCFHDLRTTIIQAPKRQQGKDALPSQDLIPLRGIDCALKEYCCDARARDMQCSGWNSEMVSQEVGTTRMAQWHREVTSADTDAISAGSRENVKKRRVWHKLLLLQRTREPCKWFREGRCVSRRGRVWALKERQMARSMSRDCARSPLEAHRQNLSVIHFLQSRQRLHITEPESQQKAPTMPTPVYLYTRDTRGTLRHAKFCLAC